MCNILKKRSRTRLFESPEIYREITHIEVSELESVMDRNGFKFI